MSKENMEVRGQSAAEVSAKVAEKVKNQLIDMLERLEKEAKFFKSAKSLTKLSAEMRKVQRFLLYVTAVANPPAEELEEELKPENPDNVIQNLFFEVAEGK